LSSTHERMVLGASAYGPRVGSVRVRVGHWLDRMTSMGLDARQWTYADLPDLSASTLAAQFRHVPSWEAGARRIHPPEPNARCTLYLHRELSPLSRGGVEVSVMEKFARRIFDFDDVLNEPGYMRRLLNGNDKYRRIIQRCDHVVAGNETLANWANSYSRDVSIVPSCVEVERYHTKVSYDLHDPPICGWIGSRTTEVFLLDLLDQLDVLHKRFGLRVMMLTSPQNEPPERAYIERRAWSEEAELTVLAECDFGIMPMPDNSFTRGKCSYKLLQYGGAALPSIGSPVGLNRQVLDAYGATGPSSDDEWVDAISDILTMPASQRAELGHRSRKAVESGYSYQRWSDVWEGIVWPGA
jgi:hypothetical protein